MFNNKKILVTGGTGSMGKTFVRRVLSGIHGTPKQVVVLSRDEAKQHEMRMDYLHKRVATAASRRRLSGRGLHFEPVTYPGFVE